MTALSITLDQARRVMVRAQLLDTPPAELAARGLVEVVDDLTLLQIDPVAALAPSADLVAWSRLGAAYDHSDLTHALEVERSLVEIGSFIRPMEDAGIALATAYDHPSARSWVAANDSFRAEVLARLEADGPLLSTDIPDTCRVPWESSGWTNDKNVVRMLDLLIRYGEVAVSGRRGKFRTYDLAERVYVGLDIPPAAEATSLMAQRCLASLGIARGRGRVDQTTVGDAGHAVVVVGGTRVEGDWRIDPDALSALDTPAEARAALLSPYDRLIYDRDRALAFFGFEYVLEMYKPAAQRRWGYYALPILYGDRLVGKLDAKADRKKGVLNVLAVHEDHAAAGGPGTAEMGDAVETEIQALAQWLGLECVTAPGGPAPRR